MPGEHDRFVILGPAHHQVRAVRPTEHLDDFSPAGCLTSGPEDFDPISHSGRYPATEAHPEKVTASCGPAIRDTTDLPTTPGTA